MQTVPTDLNSLIVYLTGGGAMAVASWVIERIPWFQKLTSQQRGAVVLGLAILIGLGATAFKQVASPELISALAPYATALLAIIGIWLIGQAAHAIDKSASAGSGQK